MFFYTGLILIRITYLRSVHMHVNRNVIPSEGWIEFHCVHTGRTLSIQPPAMDTWAALYLWHRESHGHAHWRMSVCPRPCCQCLWAYTNSVCSVPGFFPRHCPRAPLPFRIGAGRLLLSSSQSKDTTGAPPISSFEASGLFPV